ncbi:hypothetical protein LTR86_010176 [Recurvomyces mirabilis]|nr:hypothetical protein LTR86_010176 [Recurvomyces mirabilis]
MPDVDNNLAGPSLACGHKFRPPETLTARAHNEATGNDQRWRPPRNGCIQLLDSFTAHLTRPPRRAQFDQAKNDALHRMVEATLLHYEPSLACIICKVHGYAVHPSPSAIARHLRAAGHRYKGEQLRKLLVWCTHLPLNPHPNQDWCGSASQEATPYLELLDGFRCLKCGEFLTTSLELMQRHAAKVHYLDWRSRSWESCKLQTLFRETKYRHYRRVVTRDLLDAEFDGGDLATAGSTATTRPTACNFDTNEGIPPPKRSADGILVRAAHGLKVFHPWALLASNHVPHVTVEVLDEMFKSACFRTVANPLFSPAHVDSDNNMCAVFPGCEQDPLFFNALIHSLVRVTPTHRVSPATNQLIENDTISMLNKRIAAYEQTRQVDLGTLGAILMLKVASYKSRDTCQHEIHARGLHAVLAVISWDVMPERLKRAIYWQDLYAAVLVGSDRSYTSVLDVAGAIKDSTVPLPPGFLRLAEELGRDLVGCIADTMLLSRGRNETAKMTWRTRYNHLDGLQAYIESRLERVAGDCQKRGPVVESVRLATLFWCYCSWMEIWNDPFFPCQILHLLLDGLQDSLFDASGAFVWRRHLDLLYWLLFVVIDVKEMNHWQTQHIIGRRLETLLLAGKVIDDCSAAELRVVKAQATQDFLSDPPWSTRRWHGQLD